ncbi:hypothetical protein F5Y17DRAFT_456888 [Xylariaceae sp. FL0594]|nr:hypothetical protein F5Y17DRAFT_456888 [Xylariaceae sp. FL0594]
MTSDSSLTFYPQYCFHLSPTINKWCPLRGKDIADLEIRSRFTETDVYFILNHPIRWVRIVGVIVAIDDFYGVRVYTVDDGTGQCVECVLSVAKTSGININGHSNGDSKDTSGHADPTKPTDNGQGVGPEASKAPAPPPSDIDVGMVVDVKGSIRLFRDEKQIKIQNFKRVLSTNAEVLFWDKIRAFRHDTLSHPWILSSREVRKCLKLQQMDAPEMERRKTKKRKKTREPEEAQESTTAKRVNTHKSDRKTRATKTEASKLPSGKEIKYDALGL